MATSSTDIMVWERYFLGDTVGCSVRPFQGLEISTILLGKVTLVTSWRNEFSRRDSKGQI